MGQVWTRQGLEDGEAGWEEVFLSHRGASGFTQGWLQFEIVAEVRHRVFQPLLG